MLRQHSFRDYPEARFAFRHSRRAVSTQHTPRQNHILAALPLADYERLLPALEPIPLPPGWTVYGAGALEKHLYFLTAGLVSRLYVTESGATAEFAVAGSEGAIGIASFLGGESTPNSAMVVSAGYAYRLTANIVKKEFNHDSPLSHLLLHYVQALIAQTAQIAACNRHHTLDQQLCRWLLSSLDRLPSTELTITQELIAEMLGVRREGVTEAVGRLEKAGLIHHHRGHITVLDRLRLEARVCGCYAAIKREYDRLLPEYR